MLCVFVVFTSFHCDPLGDSSKHYCAVAFCYCQYGPRVDSEGRRGRWGIPAMALHIRNRVYGKFGCLQPSLVHKCAVVPRRARIQGS